MAYYSGQINSYQELLSILVNTCVEKGWAFSNQILSKNSAFFKITHHEIDGLYIQAGTDQNQSSSPIKVRLGRYGYQNIQQSFPMSYSLHIFENEVYLYTRFNGDFFYYVAFGYSNLSSWATACCGTDIPDHPGNGATISETGSWADHGRTQICGAFYDNNQAYRNSTISFDGNWISAGATSAISPLLARQPNIWNNESILIPIKIFESVTSGKVRYITELINARYLRIDNYEPEQIVSIGNDKWKIYPFYRKNTSERNYANQASHSATFGWAIRYDGP